MKRSKDLAIGSIFIIKWKDQKNWRVLYFLCYTALFSVVSALVFLPFFTSGRSMVNKVDGMTQYVVYLRYMGQYLRKCAESILSGSFSIPTYDFSIGLGDDIGQIVRFHPLDFMSIFVPGRYTEKLYEVILFIRFYLSGLSFSVFAFYWNHGQKAGTNNKTLVVHPVNVLSGAMVYTFCGYMLLRVVNHPIYAAPFIILPLLLLGAEKVMKGEGFILFPFMVFLGFWSNYYFMYIMTLGLVVYVLVRFPDVSEHDRVRAFFRLLAVMSGLYIMGLCMSFATLYPTILRYLSSSRVTQAGAQQSLFFYADKRRYFAWFLNLISPWRSSGNGLNLNFAVIVLPAIASLFSLQWKEHRTLKIMLLANLLALLIPGVGFVLAVFNNENNRWMFFIALCMGLCVTFMADHMYNMTSRTFRMVLIFTSLFLAGVCVSSFISGLDLYNTVAAIEVLAVIILLWGLSAYGVRLKTVRIVILMVTCLSIVISGYMTYSPKFGNGVKDYITSGKTIQMYENNWVSRGVSLIEDDSFYRIEAFGVRHLMDNNAEFSDYNGTSEYNSILNSGMLDALCSQNNKGLDAVTTLHGLDARPVGLNLAHVKYYLTRDSGLGAVPYGFTLKPVAESGKIKVYRNDNLLSFGYSYDSYITRESYQRLEPLERELIQLHAVVLDSEEEIDDAYITSLKGAGLKEIVEVSEEIDEMKVDIPSDWEGGTYTDGKLFVSKQGAVCTFPIELKDGYECYLCMKGLIPEKEISSLKVETSGVISRGKIRSYKQAYNLGRTDYFYRLGYSDRNGKEEITISFPNKGKYDLSAIYIKYIPMNGYVDAVNRLNTESLEDENITNSKISGNITLSHPRFVVLSVPYAEGWKLTVNGTEMKIHKANIMYQGVLLSEGINRIELVYESPGLRTGILVAVVSMALWMIMVLWQSQKGKRVPEWLNEG